MNVKIIILTVNSKNYHIREGEIGVVCSVQGKLKSVYEMLIKNFRKWDYLEDADVYLIIILK
jgi:rRNA processing protein Gar1